MSSASKAWKSCPRCYSQMPGDRDICEACEARERGEELPKPLEDKEFLAQYSDYDEDDVAEQALHVTGRPFRTDVPSSPGPAPTQHFSRMTITALILSLLLGPVGVVTGFWALKNIYEHPKRLKGSFLAWGAVLIGVIWLLAAGLIGYFYFVEWAANKKIL